jgi:hypothetical protein
MHEGLPVFEIRTPFSYEAIADSEHKSRCELAANHCVIDNEWFFLYGLIKIPVHDHAGFLQLGAWVSISKESYVDWKSQSSQELIKSKPSYFGWLNISLAMYPPTLNLKTQIHIAGGNELPEIELEPTDHPLSIEQRNGINGGRLVDLYTKILHP